MSKTTWATLAIIAASAALAAARFGGVTAQWFQATAHIFLGGLAFSQVPLWILRKWLPKDVADECKHWALFLLSLAFILSFLVELPAFIVSRSK